MLLEVVPLLFSEQSPFSVCSGLLLTPLVGRRETNRERSYLQGASGKPKSWRVHSCRHWRCILSHPSHFEILYIWCTVYVNPFWIIVNFPEEDFQIRPQTHSLWLTVTMCTHTHNGSSFSLHMFPTCLACSATHSTSMLSSELGAVWLSVAPSVFLWGVSTARTTKSLCAEH